MRLGVKCRVTTFLPREHQQRKRSIQFWTPLRILHPPKDVKAPTVNREQPTAIATTTTATKMRETQPGGGGFQTRGFAFFSGKVLIMSRTLSGMFLVGCSSTGRERGKGQIGKIHRKLGSSRVKDAFFAYSWKLPAYSGAFSLTIDSFSLLLAIGAFSRTIWAFLLTIEACLLTVGKHVL